MATLEELTAIEKQAYGLMIAARDTPRYDLYAKVWMNADRDLRKARNAAKKKTPITGIGVSETVMPFQFNDQTVKVETPDIAPVPEEVAKGTTRGRGLKPV